MRDERNARRVARQVHIRQLVAHLARHFAARQIITVAQLAAVARAPALDLQVVEERAGVIATRGDLQGRSTRSQVHGRERIAQIPSGALSAIVRVAKPELTATIRAPALDAAIGKEGAHVIRVVGPTGYLHHRACS